MKRFDEKAFRQFLEDQKAGAVRRSETSSKDRYNLETGKFNAFDEVLKALDQGKFHVERVKARTSPNGISTPAEFRKIN